MHYLFTRKLWTHRFGMLGKFAKRLVLPGNDPSFLIIGVQKGGTTSLAYYLDQHPAINQAIRKEVHFFNNDARYGRGIAWYKKNFLGSFTGPKTQLFFEGTPDYINNPRALKRIHEHYPDIKMILVLREPVARAFSAWNMRVYRYETGRSAKPADAFEVYVERELKQFKEQGVFNEGSFLSRGLYAEQLENLFSLFDKKQVLVIGSKDLSQKPKETLNEVLQFVGLPSSEWEALNNKRQNNFGYKSTIDPAMKSRLQAFYEPYNEKLFNLLGFRPNW